MGTFFFHDNIHATSKIGWCCDWFQIGKQKYRRNQERKLHTGKNWWSFRLQVAQIASAAQIHTALVTYTTNDKSCSKFLQWEDTKHKEFMGAVGSKRMWGGCYTAVTFRAYTASVGPCKGVVLTTKKTHIYIFWTSFVIVSFKMMNQILYFKYYSSVQSKLALSNHWRKISARKK